MNAEEEYITELKRIYIEYLYYLKNKDSDLLFIPVINHADIYLPDDGEISMEEKIEEILLELLESDKPIIFFRQLTRSYIEDKDNSIKNLLMYQYFNKKTDIDYFNDVGYQYLFTITNKKSEDASIREEVISSIEEELLDKIKTKYRLLFRSIKEDSLVSKEQLSYPKYTEKTNEPQYSGKCSVNYELKNFKTVNRCLSSDFTITENKLKLSIANELARDFKHQDCASMPFQLYTFRPLEYLLPNDECIVLSIDETIKTVLSDGSIFSDSINKEIFEDTAIILTPSAIEYLKTKDDFKEVISSIEEALELTKETLKKQSN